MLVLSRKRNESIIIGDNIKVTVTDIGNGRVRVGIDAPREVTVLRGEISEAKEQKSLEEVPTPVCA